MFDLQLNTSFSDRYRLLEEIGEGGMGSVYRALDRLTGQVVALKQMRVHPSDLQFTSRVFGSNTYDSMLGLAYEFRTLATLRHPNIVEVLDYGFTVSEEEESLLPFFTMRLVENAQTITEYAAHLDDSGMVRLLIEVLNALTYLHRRGIIHRDLKPGNVLVTRDGQVKVMDFGLALHQSQSISDVYGNAVGTLAYMAPELFEDEHASARSDLYSLGIIAYEMFTGVHPFKSTNIAALLTNVMTRKPDMRGLPPEIAGVIEKLLSKTWQTRYQTTEEVIVALYSAMRAPRPSEDSSVRESFLQAAKFVGREAELARLTEMMQGLAAGKGAAYLIGGESGVGKSRLLDELRIQAMVEGVTVLRGQGVADGGLPYGLWREPVRRLILSTRISDQEAGILQEIVPDIADLLEREIPTRPHLSASASQQRLTMMIVRLFKRYCENNHPTLLILEDLHWSTESLEVMKALYRALSDIPLLLLGSYRDDERPTLPDELAPIDTLTLKRLAPDAIAQLSEAMLGEAGTEPKLLDLLQRETEGNVFFLVEVVRVLAEEAGNIAGIKTMQLPDQVFAGGVQEVIQRRLSRIPEAIYDVLKLAAVIGRQIDLQVLAHALRQNLPRRLENILSVCSSAAVLEVMDDRWRFTHDKIREYILAQLRAEERPPLHRQVAEAIEVTYPNDDAYAGILVEHWHQAGDFQKEAQYAATATDQLVCTSRYRTACDLLERVLQHQVSDDIRVTLMACLGDVLVRLGDFDGADKIYQQALIQATDADDFISIYTGLSHVHWRKGDYPSAWKYAEKSYEIAVTENDEQALAKNLNDFAAISFYTGDYQSAAENYSRSLEIQEKLGNIHGAAVCLGNLASIERSQGNHDIAIRYNLRCLEIYQEVGDRQGVAVVMSNLGISTALQGDLQGSKPYFEQALAIHQEVGDRRSIALELNNLGSVAMYLEDYTGASHYLYESLRIHQEIGDKRGSALALVNLTTISIRLGNLSKAREYLREGLELSTSIYAIPMELGLLVSAVELILREGKIEQAAQWAGMIFAHPALEQETRGELEKLFPQFELMMGKRAFDAAMKDGETLALESVIHEVLNFS
jgi:tetratricopeptide (TPR) repeat protein